LERVFGVPPYVLIDNQGLAGSSTFFRYTGAVQQDYEYQVRITANNASGSSNFTNAQQNLLLSPDPTEVPSSFTWDGVVGGYLTLPHWFWTNDGGGNLTDQTWEIYGDASNPPTTLLDFGTLSTSDTSYRWEGTTTPDDYYQLVVTQTNTASVAGGGPTGILFSTIQQAVAFP
jgi:hypothetical protein